MHSACIGMQCVCYRIQTMPMQVGVTLAYCIMYCTYRQYLTLLYDLVHKLLFPDLYSVLNLLNLLLIPATLYSKVLFTFPGIFHISHPLFIDAICFKYKRVRDVQVLCHSPVWSLDVEWPQCHALGCTRWTH